MGKKKSRQQEKAIQKIWGSNAPFYFLLFLFFFFAIFLLTSSEPPKNWIEKDIIISDIAHVSTGRGSIYQITGNDGVTYSINGNNPNAENLVCGKRYHIIHSHTNWNRILSMTDSNNIYVAYDASLDSYYTSVSFAWIVILICIINALILVLRALKKIKDIKGCQ